MNTSLSIFLQPLQGAQHAPLPQVQQQIWAQLANYISRFTHQIGEVWDDYLSLGKDGGPDWLSIDGEQVVFTMPDYGGEFACSARACAHWMRAALAADYHDVSSVAQDHGWLPTGALPDLGAEVWDRDRDVAWLQVERSIYELALDSDEDLLRGDDGREVYFEDLDTDEFDAVERARETGLCPCPMCVMLRPDEEFTESMLDNMGDPNSDISSTAVWYLRQAATASVDTAMKVARHGIGEPRDHAATCHDFGAKLDEEALGVVLDELQRAEDDVTRCGVLGLAAGIDVSDDPQAAQRRLFSFVAALAEDGPVRDVAAEYAGYGQVARGHEDHFARALVQHVGTSAEYDHNVALTLFNFYMRAPAVPRFALEAVEQLAEHGSAQVQAIAAFAHAQLSTKPIG